MRTHRYFLFVLLWLWLIGTAPAHDSSAWGGLFRSRDFGASWLPADPGLYVSGALALAVHPLDPATLLYGTDTRFLRTLNGGRDWTGAGESEVLGGVFATAFDAQGVTEFAATAGNFFRRRRDERWREISLPSGAAPLRAILRSSQVMRLYAASTRGVLRSDDGGDSWNLVGELPEGAVMSLALATRPQEHLYAIVDGEVWASDDGAHTWRQHGAGLPDRRAQAVTGGTDQVWVAGDDRVYKLNHDGNWSALGVMLPERDTAIRGFAVSDNGQIFVLATHRGVYRSSDRGASWELIEGSLPVHLEAGPLVRDPHDAATLYVGFGIQPYDELWRRAARGAGVLSELSALSIVGAGAFLLLLLAGGAMLVKCLSDKAAVSRREK